ncbi:hypothetical protein COCC4DRAFT_74701 [Bipolaris maydis ATCC 48331]|uniref:Major facilitator superfamily (MFS) profile domain-containing protein n=1 Tax=Cochliobolus heterostrophus (strain C4 / ATCC 48331 / race T) TaxID=665024 RepID=N4X905_COCH4|nr:uncharacterized protein COCC4DRAFT_74701 [Bipolaris maydis ATCC 48331]ENI01687.1 hypothetical protein COCC4DRAFT_74701 [Bipolaris maydis ATCC 48331]
MAPYLNDEENVQQPYGDWRDEFYEKGYVVLKGVVPKERALKYRNKMIDWLGTFPNDFDINKPETWTKENLPQSFKNGMYLNFCAAHEKYVWEARQEPGVLAAFEKLWNTNELIVSYDTINLTLPNAGKMGGSKPWPHVDQAPERQGLSCVQGIINRKFSSFQITPQLTNSKLPVSEAGPKDGGLVVMEGSAKLFDKFFKEHPPDRTKGPLAALHYDFYPFQDSDVKWYEDRGCKSVKVCAEPGDLILWDSRQMHYAVYPETDTIRTIIYACYTPAAMASKEDLEKKKEIFEKWEATTHWPHINIYSQGKAMWCNVHPRHLGTTNCGRRHVVDAHQRPLIMAAHDPKSEASAHIEIIDAHKKAAKPVVGTVKLFDDDGIVLIPTPTRDPNGEPQPSGYPLNLPTWQKYLILVIVGLFAASANLMASGISAILPIVKASYHGDPKTSDLATWPAFFMGVGNLIAIPVAHAVGRRPVYLMSTIVLSFGCLWCACSGSLASHIAGRDIMSIAAGQAEALCPIIVQEIFYLHERGNVIAWFCALQTLGTAALIVSSSYLANDLGWRWWYGVFGCLSGAIAVLSIIFVAETKYERTLEALTGEGIDEDGTLVPVTTNTKHMLPWKGHANWSEAITCWKQMIQIIWFPNILWLSLINSVTLGIYVLMSALFAGILVQPPYLWNFDMLGYVFAGQVATAVAVPFFCGYLSDLVVKILSKRHNGVSQPEYRYIALIIPLLSTLISTIIFGMTAQNPKDWSWAGIAVTLNFEYFGFVGVVVSSFVYCMDAYPQRIDAALVLICSLRGFIGFGISFGTVSFVEKAGYEGAFNICAGIVAASMGLGIPIYFFGSKIRAITQKYAQDD